MIVDARVADNGMGQPEPVDDGANTRLELRRSRLKRYFIERERKRMRGNCISDYQSLHLADGGCRCCC